MVINVIHRPSRWPLCTYRCRRCGLDTDSYGRTARCRIPSCHPYPVHCRQQTLWSTIDGTEAWVEQMQAMNTYGKRHAPGL